MRCDNAVPRLPGRSNEIPTVDGEEDARTQVRKNNINDSGHQSSYLI